MLPILAIFLLSIIQVSFVLAAQIGVTNAVREAARLAAVTTPTTTSAEALANGQGAYDRMVDATGFLAKNVFAFNPANVITSGSPETQVCYRAITDPTGAPAVFVRVQAEYRHPIFIPLMDAILDGVDGTNDGGLRIGASEELRVENDVLTATDITTDCYNP